LVRETKAGGYEGDWIDFGRALIIDHDANEPAKCITNSAEWWYRRQDHVTFKTKMLLYLMLNTDFDDSY
jgi:hypothetical protein